MKVDTLTCWAGALPPQPVPSWPVEFNTFLLVVSTMLFAILIGTIILRDARKARDLADTKMRWSKLVLEDEQDAKKETLDDLTAYLWGRPFTANASEMASIFLSWAKGRVL